MQSISWYRVQSDEAHPEAVRVAMQDTVAPSAGSDPAVGSVAVAPPSASLNKSDSVSNLGSASKPPIPPRPEKEKSREDSSRKLNAGSAEASAESGSGSRARPVPPLPTGSSQRMKSSDLEERPPPAAPPEDEHASANRLESALSRLYSAADVPAPEQQNGDADGNAFVSPAPRRARERERLQGDDNAFKTPGRSASRDVFPNSAGAGDNGVDQNRRYVSLCISSARACLVSNGSS